MINLNNLGKNQIDGWAYDRIKQENSAKRDESNNGNITSNKSFVTFEGSNASIA
jgi:hypothetical protein